MCCEGTRACCSTTDKLNEGGIKTSTLILPIVIIVLLLGVLSSNASHFLENISHRFCHFAAFEIINYRSPIQCFDMIIIGRSAGILEQILLKSIFIAKSILNMISIYWLKEKQITVFTCNSCKWKGRRRKNCVMLFNFTQIFRLSS